MSSLRNLLLLVTLSVLSTYHLAASQSEFEQVLFEVFQSGLLDPQSGSQQVGPTQTPGPNAFPQVTLQPTPPLFNEELFPSPERSMEMSPDLFLAGSPEPMDDIHMDGSIAPVETTAALLDDLWPSASPTMEMDFGDIGPQPSPVALVPDASMEMELMESPEGSIAPEDGDIDAVMTVYDPVRVNCGSFDVRNSFMLDTEPWFNNDSFVFSDPFAKSHFGSFDDELLYSTYRYADGNLTYTIPVEAEGVWMVTLQWAEITPLAMREGARVFSVHIDGKQLESEIDVYRDSAFGSYSPLGRSHIVDVSTPIISITLAQKVGQPMLSAFQLTYMSPL